MHISISVQVLMTMCRITSAFGGLCCVCFAFLGCDAVCIFLLSGVMMICLFSCFGIFLVWGEDCVCFSGLGCDVVSLFIVLVPTILLSHSLTRTQRRQPA